MTNHMVLFNLDSSRARESYALPLLSVRRVLRMVEVTPLPKAPSVVLGVVDMHGEMIPIMSMRKRLGMDEPEADPAAQILVAETPRRSMGLVVHEVTGVQPFKQEEIISAKTMVSGVEHIAGLARIEEGIVLIHDLEKFISPQEEEQLEGLLARGAGA